MLGMSQSMRVEIRIRQMLKMTLRFELRQLLKQILKMLQAKVITYDLLFDLRKKIKRVPIHDHSNFAYELIRCAGLDTATNVYYHMRMAFQIDQPAFEEFNNFRFALRREIEKERNRRRSEDCI